jgi:hypothetical protein
MQNQAHTESAMLRHRCTPVGKLLSRGELAGDLLVKLFQRLP